MDEDEQQRSLAPELAPAEPEYEPTDIFNWANNLVQYKGDLHVDMFFFNKGGITYRTSRSSDLDNQMEPLFVDELLEEILAGAETGMEVREFEAAESEGGVLQRTRLKNVDAAVNVLRWVRTQEHEMELFSDEIHDIKRMKGVIARVTHKGMKPFYVIKQLPLSQMMSG
ncbi:MAG TPA: hypothetical protein VF597_02615, partial [Candidatus Saccharimonadales bacterium]